MALVEHEKNGFLPNGDFFVVKSIDVGHANIGIDRVPTLLLEGRQGGKEKTVALLVDPEHLRGLLEAIPRVYGKELKE